MNLHGLSGATSLLLAGWLALLAATACSDAPSPRVGDHWRASYAINICGREQAPLPAFEGGLRTDGDGVIHIQPSVPSDEGEGSRLVEFLRNAGGDLSRRSLALPGEIPWRTGNACPGGRPGKVVVVVNQGRLGNDLDSYVPQDGDRIVIAFIAAGDPDPPLPPAPDYDEGHG